MPKKYNKIDPPKQVEVLKIVKDGGTYGDAVKYLKERYDIGVSTVSIHKLVKRTKEFFTEGFLEAQMSENQKSDLAITTSLVATLEIAMEMYEELIRELKDKRDNEGWGKGDFLMLDRISQRLLQLRNIMLPSVSVSKEISFTKRGIGEKYHVKEE